MSIPSHNTFPSKTPNKKRSFHKKIVLAAAMRMAGESWQVIAETLSCPPNTVRRWPIRQAELWQKAIALAEVNLLNDAMAESVHTLRKQLRSADEKSSRDAAQKLIQARLKVANPPIQNFDLLKTNSSSRDYLRIASYLESLSHDEQDRLFADLIASIANEPQPGSSKDGAAGPAAP